MVIPELESGVLEADLSPSAAGAIRDYVSNGGRLVIGGGVNSVRFLNAIFGWSLVSVPASLPTDKLGATVGTDFETGPASLPILSATRHLSRGSLPTGSTPLYGAGRGSPRRSGARRRI